MTLITLSILSFSRSICHCLLLPYLVGIDLSLSSSTISRWHTVVLFLILNPAVQMAGWFAGEKACVLSGCCNMRRAGPARAARKHSRESGCGKQV